MSIKELMAEVIDEEQAREDLKKIWEWIAHNMIHSINALPQFKHILKHTDGLIGIDARVRPENNYEDYHYGMCLFTQPKRVRKLRTFCNEGFSVMPSLTANGICQPSDLDFVRLTGGITVEMFPCSPSYIGAFFHGHTVEIANGAKLFTYIDSHIHRVPGTVDTFDHREFRRYMDRNSIRPYRMTPSYGWYFHTDWESYQSMYENHLKVQGNGPWDFNLTTSKCHAYDYLNVNT
jgi:hypothetical protein